ncbi:DsbA family protein [Ureibacillus sp. FSL K6-8385]|uniref:ClpXP adapter protein SpxH n=1 Tax=Ureibacillus terrenus TaxID=118246 RepID=A0A540V3N2_9BACL|nr:DsbA family protein [Ureibacillus terrenus]MED3661829.1 DsbA family protein [Ureibacillus terrenus]MED3763132.1 DsbA family protein [Ureibacillus terrenus]TQE91360.1 DsbA family protein [Ureibacillus terrenus]
MNNIQLVSEPVASDKTSKPIELYVFIDPLCPNAFKLQSLLKKLQLEYEHYFTWRYVLSTELTALNCVTRRIKGCFTGADVDITHPALPSLAIKAAELQGKKAANRYIRKLQEHALLGTKNVHSYTALVKMAKEANLDQEEFVKDFGSKEAVRAFQCDLYITREMEIDEVPSIVFFNEYIEEEGLKVSGIYSYEIYVHILQEMLDEKIVRKPLPSFDELFQRFHYLTTDEVASIYSISISDAERELKKRMLQQKIERVSNETVTLWRLKQPSFSF